MLTIDDIQEVIETTEMEDQSVTVGGGNFTYEKLPMGKHQARLVSYIEYGDQPQPEYNGEKKDDAPTVDLVFEFLSKRTIKDKEDGSGQYAPRQRITLKKSFHEKAGYRKLFEKMRGGDSTITHMSQMLAVKHWIINVEWTTKEEGKRIVIKKKDAEKYLAREKAEPDNKDVRIYANIKGDGGYMISAPFAPILDEDGEDTGETKPINCPPHIGPLTMFLWDDCSPKLWASIFVDGTYTRKENGKEIEVSKNRYQEKCLAASNFAGSDLEAMLLDLGDLDEKPKSEAPKEEKKTKAKETKKAEPVEDDLDDETDTAEKSDTASVVDEIEDEMDELGL